MKAAELCEKYRDALSKRDLPAIQALFTPDAIIKAPISGTATVEQFHSYLFSQTVKNVAKFPNVLGFRDRPVSITMQFSYTLSIATGDVAVLDGVAVFDIEENLGKVQSLSFVYNPTELRHFMDESGIVPPVNAARGVASVRNMSP